MSNENTEKCHCNFQQQHFLVLSYEQQKQHKQPPPNCRYNHGKYGKSRGGNRGTSICWLLSTVLVQLLYATESTAQILDAAAAAAPPNNIPSAASVVTSSIDATAEVFIENKSRVSKRSHHSTFSDLDKEVGMAGIPS